jgi:hypothetical protein
MSLSDALLTEGWRDPREIYIALRSDGLRGSGTIDDPYDGGARLGSPVGASVTLDRKEVIVGTTSPHGFALNDTVQITGVSGPSEAIFNTVFNVLQVLSPTEFRISLGSVPVAPPVDYTGAFVQRTAPTASASFRALRYWPVPKVSTTVSHGLASYDLVNISGIAGSTWSSLNGRFVTVGASTNAFWYRLSSLTPINIPGADTTTPLTGAACAKLTLRFDGLMESLPANTVVHLAPGEFERAALQRPLAAAGGPRPGKRFMDRRSARPR